MTDTNKSSSLWGTIGKISIFLTASWVLIQICNYIFKPSQYQASVIGRCNHYELAPTQSEAIKGFYQYKALATAIANSRGTNYSKADLDTTIARYNSDSVRNPDKYIYHDELSKLLDSSLYRDYKYILTFSITNPGNEPLEDLTLTLPYSGQFTMELPDGTTKSGLFSGIIKIGELDPSYQIKINCWLVIGSDDPEYLERQIKLTHKKGWFSVTFPEEVTGFYSWMARYVSGVSWLFIFVLIGNLIYATYMLGYRAGLIKYLKKSSNSGQTS